MLNHEKVVKSYQDLEKNLKEQLTKKDEQIDTLEVENKDLKSALEALKYQLDLKEKRSQSYFGLNQELKSEINSLREHINALEASKEELEEKIDSKANMSDLEKKGEQFLQGLIDKHSQARTGTDESESSHTKKTNLERLQEKQKKSSLLDKFAEVDKVQEQEAPVKKRSYRER